MNYITCIVLRIEWIPVWAVVFVVAVASIAVAEESAPGIIIYSTIDNARDEIAIAIPFEKAEKHALVTNVTKADGETFRVTNNQFKQIVRPTDLSRSTVVDKAGLEKLRSEAASIRALQDRYPRAKAMLAPYVTSIENLVQAIGSGNVLVQGKLVPRADYEKQMGASAPKTIDLTVDGRSYSGAKLSSFRNGVASIMHSGGVASVEVGQLSDDQIKQLNATSASAVIAKPNEANKTAAGKGMKFSETGRGKAETPIPSESGGDNEGTTADQAAASVIGVMPDIDKVAALLHRKLQGAQEKLGKSGRQLQIPSAREIADRTAEGVGKFLAFDAGALVASNVIDNFGDKSGRERHRKLLAELAFARTQEDASHVKQEMIKHAQGYFTGEIDKLHAFGATEVGREQMNRSMSQPMKNALAHVAFLQETRSRQSVQISFQREMAGISVLSETQVHFFHSKFDILTKMKIAEALQTGNWAGVDLSILGDEKTQGAYKQFLSEAQLRSGGILGRQLQVYIIGVLGDPTLSNTFSEMDERDYYRSVIPDMIEEDARKRGFENQLK